MRVEEGEWRAVLCRGVDMERDHTAQCSGEIQLVEWSGGGRER